MLGTLNLLRQDEAAATAVEYALLLSLVALAALSAVLQLGAQLRHLYQHAAELFRRQTA